MARVLSRGLVVRMESLEVYADPEKLFKGRSLSHMNPNHYTQINLKHAIWISFFLNQGFMRLDNISR